MATFTKEYTADVQKLYDELMGYCQTVFKDDDLALIRKAFEFSDEAHKEMKRRSGEPFIVHPLAVAIIVASELKLGPNAIASALLHDVVEDTEYTLEDISREFNPLVAKIVDGLTKISGVISNESTLQAENFRKILLTLIDDPRVILIKLADRLHNMRTLESLARNKQIKISGETIYLFAPLAHRLGLYKFKTELENLSLKFRYPNVYEEIEHKIQGYEQTRSFYVNNFTEPIGKKLHEEGFTFDIIRRPKSIYDIWYIMQHENIPFEEVYDLIQVNIVFDPQNNLPEKTLCWQVYSLITDVYMPKPEMIRDFVTKPKANGYEALHATFMGPNGKWVDVQIKTRRMNDVAERGLAAYLETREGKRKPGDIELNQWLQRVIEVLEAPEDNTLEFLDDFRLNLFTAEILIFTPKGHLKTLPKDSTVLDFAYEIHSEIGNKAIAAKVNHKLVSLSHVLNSGDQVEILTSDKKRTSYEWMEFAKTAKARTSIKKALKNELKNKVSRGKRLFEEKLREMNLTPSAEIIKKVFISYKASTKDELYGKIGAGIINLDELQKIVRKKTKSKLIRYWELQLSKSVGRTKKGMRVQNIDELKIDKNNPFVIAENLVDKDPVYKIASCCKPIPGDEVMGHRSSNDKVIIHKTSCPSAVKIMSNHGDLIVPVKWTTQKILAYLVRIGIEGIDNFTIYNDITTVISKQLNVKIGGIKLDSHDGLFDGTIDLYVHSTKDLNNLIMNISKIGGIESVKRIEVADDE